MSAWLLLSAYAVVIAPAVALVAWGVLRRFGCYEARPAALGAIVVWAALVGTPVVGMAVDHARASTDCTVQHECYEHFFAVTGVPAGWLVTLLGVAGALFIGRTFSRHAS